LLGLGEVDEDELYNALDWLLERQPAIEATLAKRHLTNGTLVLYDVSSSYMEGRCCPLAKRGYSRDGKKGTLQIVCCRLSTVCSAPRMAALLPSKCSRATPPIR
jgi:transposase